MKRREFLATAIATVAAGVMPKAEAKDPLCPEGWFTIGEWACRIYALPLYYNTFNKQCIAQQWNGNTIVMVSRYFMVEETDSDIKRSMAIILRMQDESMLRKINTNV